MKQQHQDNQGKATDAAVHLAGEIPRQPDTAASLEDMLKAAAELARESSEQLRAVAKLAVLELKLSASSVKLAAGVSILFGVGLIITWSLATLTVAAAAMWAGVPLPLALLLCAILNGALTLWLYKLLQEAANDIGFSRLRKFLEDTKHESTKR